MPYVHHQITAMLLLATYSQAVPQASNPELFFKSGFEEPVTLTHRSDGQASYLHGADQGHDWDSLDHIFNYVALDALGQGYVETRLSDIGEPVHSGERSLFQAQYAIEAGAQNRLQINNLSDSTFGSHVFTRRRIYWDNPGSALDKQFESTPIAGLRQHDNSLSVWPRLGHNGNKLYFRIDCVDYNLGSTWSERLLWQAENAEYPVPVDQWVTIDYYVYRHPTAGVARLWVNGDLVISVSALTPPSYFNFSGPGVVTKNGDSPWFLKLADIDLIDFDGGTFSQWVDDVEVWRGKNPYKGPYILREAATELKAQEYPQRLFSSGFEGSVVVEPPFTQYGQYWQQIAGLDTASGFRWPDDLPVLDAVFHPLINANTPVPEDYSLNRIESVPGPLGGLTQALYQEVRGDDPSFTSWTRSNYVLYPEPDLKQAYTVYWVKLQADLESALAAGGGWYNMYENKCADDTYRYTLYVKQGTSEGLYWHLEAQTGTAGNSPIDWSYTDTEIPVPAGDWARLEFFFEQSVGPDGRVWVGLNGETLFDHRGRTMVSTPVDRWMPFKVYVDPVQFQNGFDAHQWIDDCEIWSGFPPGHAERQ